MRIAKIFIPVLIWSTCFTAYSQVIFYDNFQYSTGNLTQGGSPWSLGQGDSDLVVVDTNLTYPQYASDNTLARSVLINSTKSGTSTADIGTPQSGSGTTVYYSFLLNVSDAPTATDGFNYFTGFLESSPTTAFATVYAIDSSGYLKIGLSRADAAVLSKAVENLTFNATHLIVVKYVFKGGVQDDSAYLFINPTLPGTEPAPSAATFDNGFPRPTELAYVLINQTNTNGVDARIDAIRIGNIWADAPLPVQLTNFAATSSLFGVDLRWSTATELNNYGFDIERRKISQMSADTRGFESGNDGISEWNTVGFVQGAGTSTSPRDYSYTDAKVDPGRYAYRIKQIDLNAAFTYYSAAEVEVGLGPKELALEPNYPNPFNPSTNITFTVPLDGRAALKVYNMLGQEVATLFDEEAVAGRVYQKTFDASSLPTGVYVSRLEFGGQSVMRKMLFVK